MMSSSANDDTVSCKKGGNHMYVDVVPSEIFLETVEIKLLDTF